MQGNALQKIWRTIAADNVSGANEIYQRVLQAFLQHVSSLPPTPEALQDWPLWLRGMLRAQPAMAPLYNLANRLALIFEQEHARAIECLTQALAFLQVESLQASQANGKIAEQAVPLVAKHLRLFTHSYSSTVAVALELAFRDGHAIEVFLSEARPAFEGRRMAERLARAGLTVHLGVDDARGHMLNEVGLVVLGADHVSETSFVNKIGSRSLALLARVRKIPVAVFAARNKLWPAQIPLAQEPEHTHAEIWRNAPATVRLSNLYFEAVEIQLMRCLVTEQSQYTIQQLRQELKHFVQAKFWRTFT